MSRKTGQKPRELNPADEAVPGTPGTGDDLCPHCKGSGRLDNGACPHCGGTGIIIRGIGGG